MNIKESWAKLPPKTQRYVAVGGSLGVLMLALWAALPGGHEAGTTKKDKEVIRNIITDADTRKVGIDSINANMQISQREIEENKKKLDQLQQQLIEDKKQTEQRNADEIKRLRDELEATRGGMSGGNGTPPTSRGATAPAGSTDPFDASPLTARDGGPAGFDVRVVSQDAGSSNQAVQKDRNEHEAYIPPGSILTGIIITGVDASTGQGARREPFPVMVRINKEAVLPNDYSADVRECFVLLGVYGDLASERIYGRGENLSCIRNDGKVLESKFDGFVSGEDGKNGVRGRLINRDGPLLMRAALAGFMQAWSGAMGANPVPVVATTASSSVQYQNVFSSQALQNAAAQGTGKAFEKLADYYLKLADSIQPIIEVDAGREVNMILTGSLRLRLRD